MDSLRGAFNGMSHGHHLGGGDGSGGFCFEPRNSGAMSQDAEMRDAAPQPDGVTAQPQQHRGAYLGNQAQQQQQFAFGRDQDSFWDPISEAQPFKFSPRKG